MVGAGPDRAIARTEERIDLVALFLAQAIRARYGYIRIVQLGLRNPHDARVAPNPEIAIRAYGQRVDRARRRGSGNLKPDRDKGPSVKGRQA